MGGFMGGQDYLLAVFDPMTTYDNDGLSHPFDNGATFMGVFGWPTKFGTSMGRHSLTATYSTLTTRSLTSGGWIILPDPPRPLPEKEGTWTVNYSFDQYLGYRPSSPSKGFGVFGELGFSDGDPNAIELYASLGVGGTSPLKGREQDSFGFGVFYMGLGDSVKDGFAPLIRLGDETGIEAYYNWAATPWLRLTGDLQVVDPALANRETAVILGLRSEVRF
jgi:porin